MSRQDSFSWVSKSALTAAVVLLIAGAEQPDAQPLSQTAHQPAERILPYDAQPVGIAKAGPASETIDFTPRREEQRWIF
nr:hypothetical protein [Pseudomonas sp.]